MKWIIGENPKEEGRYLVLQNNSNITIRRFSPAHDDKRIDGSLFHHDESWWGIRGCLKVVAWMELPPLPEGVLSKEEKEKIELKRKIANLKERLERLEGKKHE